MRLFSKLNTKDLVIFFNRSTGPLHDSCIRKMMTSLSLHGLACEGMLFTKSNRYTKYFYKPNAWVFTLPLLITSKNPIRGGAFINGIEIIQETLASCLYILYRRPKYVIVQNHRLFLVTFFSILLYKRLFKSRLVWDLRELPNGFMTGSFKIIFINFLFRNCCSVIIANQSRLDYMQLIYGKDCLKHACVISNFENSSFINAEKRTLPTSVSSFLSGRQYIYVQNPFDLDRGLIESLSLISENKDFCVLVSGGIPESIIERINTLFGNTFIKSNVFFTGWINDLSLVELIDNAYASIVIYKYIDNPSYYHSLNNRYCASNTLYQSICRGTPVLTGCNEGMSQNVRELGVGVVTSDDGSAAEVIKSFQNLKNNYISIKQACDSKKGILSWESQEQILIDAVIG